MKVKELTDVEETRGDAMSAFHEADYLLWLMEVHMRDVCLSCGFAGEGSKAKWDYEMQCIQERVWRECTTPSNNQLPF